MKAAVLTQFNTPLHIQELDVPTPDYGQVLVKIHSSGICGAQLGQIGGTKMREEFLPCLMGHEGGGEVLRVGEGVTSVKKGDRVVLHWRQGSGIESQFPVYHTTDGTRVGSGLVTTFNEVSLVSENRVTKVDDDSFRLFLKRAISDYVDGQYLDSDFILDLPYYSSFDFAPDSIQFNIKRYIQKLVTNEYDYHGLILSTDGLNGNFDIFQFKNSIEKQVKLDILYTK